MPRTKMWYIFYTFIVFGLFSGVGLYLALYLNDGAILTRPATGAPTPQSPSTSSGQALPKGEGLASPFGGLRGNH